jgi:hypothetical protein
MNTSTKIYLVTNCNNQSNDVYIGKTINPDDRKKDHQYNFGKYIQYTIIDEIDSLDRKFWQPLETYWIQQFKCWGFNVLNIQENGGSGVSFHTEETKNKIKKSKSLKPNPRIRKDIEYQKLNIISRYKNGEGVHIISSDLKCHSDVIKRILRENNVVFRNKSESQKSRKDLKQTKRKDLWDNIDKIIILYKFGKTYTEIGKIYNTSDVQIKLMLKKKNIL